MNTARITTGPFLSLDRSWQSTLSTNRVNRVTIRQGLKAGAGIKCRGGDELIGNRWACRAGTSSSDRVQRGGAGNTATCCGLLNNNCHSAGLVTQYVTSFHKLRENHGKTTQECTTIPNTLTLKHFDQYYADKWSVFGLYFRFYKSSIFYASVCVYDVDVYVYVLCILWHTLAITVDCHSCQ